jgi:hypothetical protein
MSNDLLDSMDPWPLQSCFTLLILLLLYTIITQTTIHHVEAGCYFPLALTGEYGALPLSQCAWFYASGNILATTCSSTPYLGVA